MSFKIIPFALNYKIINKNNAQKLVHFIRIFVRLSFSATIHP